MSDLMLDVGLANELKMAFRRNGYSEAEVKKLAEGTVLGDMRRVLLGHASITVTEHLIDCDADPFVPDGWSVGEHRKGGILKWNAAKVKLWLASGQQKRKYIEGNKLHKELAKKPVFNANLLDYLLVHPELIPEEWKGKYVFFWGTVYRGPGGDLFVRFLYWRSGRWDWNTNWLDNSWSGNNPAALSAALLSSPSGFPGEFLHIFNGRISKLGYSDLIRN